MKVKQLDLSLVKDLLNFDDLVFVKLFGGKLFRCFGIPEAMQKDDDKYKELVQVLNTFCIRKHKNVWYFKLDDDAKEDVGTTMALMNISLFFMEPDECYYN